MHRGQIELTMTKMDSDIPKVDDRRIQFWIYLMQVGGFPNIDYDSPRFSYLVGFLAAKKRDEVGTRVAEIIAQRDKLKDQREIESAVMEQETGQGRVSGVAQSGASAQEAPEGQGEIEVEVEGEGEGENDPLLAADARIIEKRVGKVIKNLERSAVRPAATGSQEVAIQMAVEGLKKALSFVIEWFLQLIKYGEIVEGEFPAGVAFVVLIIQLASQFFLEYFIKEQAGFDLEALKEESILARVALWALHLLFFYVSSQWLMRWIYATNILPTTRKDKQHLNFNDFQDLCLLVGNKPFKGGVLSVLNNSVDISNDGVLRATWIATVIKQRPTNWLDLALIYKLQALLIWYKKLKRGPRSVDTLGHFSPSGERRQQIQNTAMCIIQYLIQNNYKSLSVASLAPEMTMRLFGLSDAQLIVPSATLMGSCFQHGFSVKDQNNTYLKSLVAQLRMSTFDALANAVNQYRKTKNTYPLAQVICVISDKDYERYHTIIERFIKEQGALIIHLWHPDVIDSELGSTLGEGGKVSILLLELRAYLDRQGLIEGEVIQGKMLEVNGALCELREIKESYSGVAAYRNYIDQVKKCVRLSISCIVESEEEVDPLSRCLLFLFVLEGISLKSTGVYSQRDKDRTWSMRLERDWRALNTARPLCANVLPHKLFACLWFLCCLLTFPYSCSVAKKELAFPGLNAHKQQELREESRPAPRPESM